MKIGIDLGGTKTEVAAFDEAGRERLRRREPTPGGNYTATLTLIQTLIRDTEHQLGTPATIGIGTPGAASPDTGLMRNCNSTCLNGKPLKDDLQHLLQREVRLSNDANCFALSEAVDGAGAGHRVVFGVILGTGCGGGLVVDGKVIQGRQRLTGEWGHAPLPWMTPEEYPGHKCWCGAVGCLEIGRAHV